MLIQGIPQRLTGFLLALLLVGLVAVLVLLVSYQVFARYLDFIPAFGWTEEVSRGCFIWMVVLGASLGVAHGTHFAIEVLTTKLAAKGRLFLHFILLAVTLSTALVFVLYGWGFFLRGFRRVSLVTGLPMAWTYGCLFVSGLCMVLFSIQDFCRLLRGLRRSDGKQG